MDRGKGRNTDTDRKHRFQPCVHFTAREKDRGVWNMALFRLHRNFWQLTIKRNPSSHSILLVTRQKVAPVEAWSFKNTALAAQIYMLACSAHGLATCPMEGFDGRR